jgi:hypothetical protein
VERDERRNLFLNVPAAPAAPNAEVVFHTIRGLYMVLSLQAGFLIDVAKELFAAALLTILQR